MIKAVPAINKYLRRFKINGVKKSIELLFMNLKFIN